MRDIDIRRALRSEMERLHERDRSTLIVDELSLCLGQARVDLAVVNGSIEGYEIKSERDTLARLPAQTVVYNRIFDRITIVVSEAHATRALDVVPTWWGILLATEEDGVVHLTSVRPPRDNPSTDSLAKAQLLWREETLHALEARELAAGLRTKPRRVLWAKLAASLSPDELSSVVRDCLKRRTSWRVGEQPALGGGWSQPSAKW